ncbi:TIGR01459 family HAD-type hydrolase [Rhizobium grahamii]|uniref:Hydrolase IIA n=1 Tax=Rhizobium grahamii CCGE 502 TaxID=990285 RepID=S3HDX2_9HYPH|nr:TIGR01459 family HAD-type hydrolase [Rhizobium grahamii]EPE97037.1 hydrolase IIA [Rhizobium grahamii CCGE 502]
MHKSDRQQETLRSVAESYEGFIIDLFGVVHDGVRSFPPAIEALGYLRSARKRICLLSNSPRRAHQVANRLHSMKIDMRYYDTLITSGELVFEALATREHPFMPALGSRYLHIGPGELSGLLTGLAFRRVADASHADFVLATGAFGQTADLAELKEAAARHLPLICANPDLSVMIGDREVACAGVVAAEYETVGGRVYRFGKPTLPTYQKALRTMQLPPSRVLAIGDSLETDIRGASQANVTSALVLSGIHHDYLMTRHGFDRPAFEQLCEKLGARPRLVLSSLGLKEVALDTGYEWQ